ncbi:MAG: hypothetical protein ACQERN_00400 [Thermodesulfobacteriota bacterium]
MHGRQANEVVPLTVGCFDASMIRSAAAPKLAYAQTVGAALALLHHEAFQNIPRCSLGQPHLPVFSPPGCFLEKRCANKSKTFHSENMIGDF